MVSGNEVNFFFNYITPKPANYVKEGSEKFNEWKTKRDFFSCDGKRSYLSYMETGSPEDNTEYMDALHNSTKPNYDNEFLKKQDNSQAVEKNYFSYMEQERKNTLEKSKGLFDRNGMCSKKTIFEHRSKLSETKGNIWEGVITFEKEFGEKYCNTSDQAMVAMQHTFKRFLDFTHIKDRNVNWVAALHENTKHFHIHYTFYEKEPWRENAQGEKCYTNKGTISIDSINYLKESFYAYFTQKSINAHNLRDTVIKKLKATRENSTYASQHFFEFKKLSIELNLDKNIKYEQLSEDKQNKIKTFVINYMKNDKELFELYTDTFAKLFIADKNIKEFAEKRGAKQITTKAESFKADFFKRMGNSVLSSCKFVQYENEKKENSIAIVRAMNVEKEHKKNNHLKVVRNINKSFDKLTRRSYENTSNEVLVKNKLWLKIQAEYAEKEMEEEMQKYKHNEV